MVCKGHDDGCTIDDEVVNWSWHGCRVATLALILSYCNVIILCCSCTLVKVLGYML